MNALVTIETLTPAIVFAPGGVESIVSKLETEVRAIKTDISTDRGRKEIASLAYKVARSKTALDEMGKDLVAEIKVQAGKIDAERRVIRDRLEALKDEVRKPLTDWENAEKDRIACHENALLSIRSLTMFDSPPTSSDIKRRIDALVTARPRDWQEFANRAADVEQCVIAALNGMHQEAVKREAEIAELERFRAKQAARAQKEREDRIAAEAAEVARVAAENKAAREAAEVARAAEVERLLVLQEKAAAIAKAEKAEADRNAAIAKALHDAHVADELAERKQAAAIEAERKRAVDEHAKVMAETAAREANTKHKAKINNEIVAALGKLGFEGGTGKMIVEAIARGNIPHVKIVY